MELSAVLMLLGGLLNLLMFLLGVWMGGKAVHRWMVPPGRCFVDNIRHNIFLVVKLCTVPVCALVWILVAIVVPVEYMRPLLHVCSFWLPLLLFTALKLFYLRKQKRRVTPAGGGTPNSLHTSATTTTEVMGNNSVDKQNEHPPYHRD